MKRFIDEKSFSGRDGFEVTTEVKAAIAASAVQLTFGLDTWDLSYFGNILVFPSDYQNPVTKKYHKGETNLSGFICFAWDHFEAGNLNPDDKINLGLHEFAHALRFNGIKGNDTDYFFENYFPKWMACATKEFQKLRDNEISIFRKYGSVNINEFFSVSVETFFENPHQFETYLPELYHHTAILLNQVLDQNKVPTLNCREAIMARLDARLSRPYADPFSYRLNVGGPLVMSVLFVMVGLLTFFTEGYKTVPPYICMGVAVVCWLLVERRYARISFSQTGFRLQKGYFLLRGYQQAELPISHLISITGSDKHESHHRTLLGEASVVYYYDTDFYEEELDCSLNQPEFDMLCEELKKNSVHVYIKE